jgi:hypothetical protein
MEDIELQKKRQKAEEYVKQPERFSLTSARLKMSSTHGTRLISYDCGKWECSCDFFQKRGECSHTMAAQAILGMNIRFDLNEK